MWHSMGLLWKQQKGTMEKEKTAVCQQHKNGKHPAPASLFEPRVGKNETQNEQNYSQEK